MRKLLAIATAFLLALTISACGGDDDDDDDTGADDTEETTDDGGDEGAEEASQRDRFIEGLLAQGRTEENANCMVEAIEAQFPDYSEDELYAVEGAPDDVTAAVPDIAAQCDEEFPNS